MADGRKEKVKGGGRVVAVVDEWLWGMLVCLTFFSEVVYRSVLLIGIELACSVVPVSKHVSPVIIWL